MPPPVESFAPGLMAALLRGATGGFSLSMPYRSAVKFRHRIYQLRVSMRDTKHDKYSLVSRVKITIDWPPGTQLSKTRRNVPFPTDRNTMVEVKIAPSDSEFEAALRAAGVDADLDIDLADLDSPGGGKAVDIGAILKDLK